MPEQFPATRYWGRVVVHAFKGAGKFLGHNPRKSIFGWIVAAIALAIYWYVEGPIQALGKAEWVGTGLLAALSVHF
jgi:hypothetical protein